MRIAKKIFLEQNYMRFDVRFYTNIPSGVMEFLIHIDMSKNYINMKLQSDYLPI